MCVFFLVFFFVCVVFGRPMGFCNGGTGDGFILKGTKYYRLLYEELKIKKGMLKEIDVYMQYCLV